MRTPIQTLLVAAALLGTGAAPARGQNPSLDSRWLAYIGCWERTESTKSLVCVVPAAGTSAVDLLTIQKGQIVARERITATGGRVATAHDACTGWQSVEWSARGPHLYLRSEDTCAAGNTEGSGVIAMDPDGSQWLYIQGMTLGGQTGVTVQRYREATDDLLLPDDVKAAIQMDVSAKMQARAAAALSLATDDVVEASRRVDTSVLEAWLVERGEPFTLDAKRLVGLADAGVPTRIIDLMVALSYPKVFAINATSRQGERRPSTRSSGGGYRGGNVGYGYATRPYGFYDQCSMNYLLWGYISGECSGWYPGYAFGPGTYPGGYPVQIVFIGSGNSRAHGHVVNGQGYKEGASTNADAMPRSGDWGSVTPSGGWSPSSSSSSGSGEQRTAKPRP